MFDVRARSFESAIRPRELTTARNSAGAQNKLDHLANRNIHEALRFYLFSSAQSPSTFCNKKGDALKATSPRNLTISLLRAASYATASVAYSRSLFWPGIGCG